MLGRMILLLIIALATADLYMHSPPGSNNRNRERKDNRNNANRLFDSQNNGKGGYPWRGDPKTQTSDPVTYYVGSKLRVEWTSQHGCGANPNLHCELVIQAACEDTMPAVRDGYPQSGNCWNSQNANQQGADVPCSTTNTFLARKFLFNTNEGTKTIPTGRTEAFYNGQTAEGLEYGMHENYTWYSSCQTTERNKRLYTSDQKLKGNTAQYTRQNPNGGRRGLECPEERDYYPYWRPTPWRDVAVLVSNISYCDFYEKNSQNVIPVGYCDCGNSASAGNPCPITEAKCASKGFTWKMREALGGGAPDCQYHPFSRDNHLGNVYQVDPMTGDYDQDKQPETAFYEWTIPDWAKNQQCILRMRYNMSTKDYDSHRFAESPSSGVGADSSLNCPYVTSNPACANGDPDCEGGTNGVPPACYTFITSQSIPLQNRPYVDAFEGTSAQSFELGLAINTHQTGRTFQDRSYVFTVADAPVGGKIYNLGLRGRRGNIVQAYPSVEYDFTPSLLELTQDDYVHIQFHGSDFNAAKNANNGEGWKFSDRTNMVQMRDRTKNYPTYHSRITMFNDQATAKRFAWLGQNEDSSYTCLDIQRFDNNQANQNNINNCGKLNRAPNRFPQNPQDGLVKMDVATGDYYYYSTRNNNFSNRSQKGQFTVTPGADATDPFAMAKNAGIAFGVLFAVGFTGAAVFSVLKYKNMWCFGKGSNNRFTKATTRTAI